MPHPWLCLPLKHTVSASALCLTVGSLFLLYLSVSPGAICTPPSISPIPRFTLNSVSYPQLSASPPVPCLTVGCLSVQAPWDCSSNQAHAPIRANMTFQVLALSGVTFKSEWLSGRLRLMCTVIEDNANRCSGLRILYVWESTYPLLLSAPQSHTTTNYKLRATNTHLLLSASVFLFLTQYDMLSIPLFFVNNTLFF